MHTLFWKSNWKHATLEYLIKEIDPSPNISRNTMLNRGLEVAKDLNDDEWRNLSKELKYLRKIEGITVPTSMQANVNDMQVWGHVNDNIKRSLSITTLRTNFAVSLIWLCYLKSIQQEAMDIRTDKETLETMDAPNMVKTLVQILLLNRSSDAEIIEKIKELLISWKNDFERGI